MSTAASGSPPTRTPVLAGYLALAMGIGPLAQYALSALGPLVVDDLELSATEFGSLWLVGFGTAAICTPFVSRLTDRLGARRMLSWDFACAGAALVILAASTSLTAVLAGVTVAGVAVAISGPATNSAVSGAVSRERLGVVVGAKQSGVQLSQLFAGLALPGVAVWLGWRPAVLLCVLLAVIGVVSGRWAIGGAGTAERVVGSGASIDRTVWWLSGYALVAGAIIQATNVYLPLYAHSALGWSVGEAGMVAAVLGGSGVIARIAWGSLIDKVPNVAALLLGMTLLAGAGLAVCGPAAAVSPGLVWVGAALFGVSALAVNAVIMSSVVLAAEPGSVGRATGWTATALFAGFMAGPITFGMVVDSSAGYPGAWTYLGMLTVVLVVLTAAWSLTGRRTPAAVRARVGPRQKESC